MGAPRFSASHFDTHRTDAQMEDVQWMLDQGETLERALRRAGVTLAAWEARSRRKC